LRCSSNLGLRKAYPSLLRVSEGFRCYPIRPTEKSNLDRSPHVRRSEHPDFLSSSLTLANFMRLSLMKAAHAPVGGAPSRKSGTMGRKRRGAAPSQRFCYVAKKLRPRARVLAHGVKALEKSVLGPCTLWRTWGTRPAPLTVVGGSNPPELADLIWTGLKFSQTRPGKRASFFAPTTATPMSSTKAANPT
jgi:hypothetical protein